MLLSRSLVFFTVGLTLSVTVAAETNSKFQAISKSLTQKAELAAVGNKPEEARELFERAIIANPANIDALVGLGKSYETQGSTGTGLKYYRQALEVDPNDQVALERQAVAFLKKDMIDRAEGNLTKLSHLCPESCEALEAVQKALNSYHAKAIANQSAAVAVEPKAVNQ